MKIAIDFDGVICKRGQQVPRPRDFRKDGKPMAGVKQALHWMIEEGHDIYVFTARHHDDFPQIKDWMKEHELPGMRVTNNKEVGTKMYIDDRAVRFTNWEDMSKMLG